MTESLLPPNATPFEIALEGATARLGAVPVEIIATMQSPQNCPAEILPWLAWAFSVDDWDDTWSEAQKRATVAASYQVHRHKGTIGAVRAALAALGIQIDVVEWFQESPPGDPYTFRLSVGIDQDGVSQQQYARILSVVNSSKNLRSHMTSVDVEIATRSDLFMAAATGVGFNICVLPG
jgi:phage tail P2-like protein